jgi:membrane protein implicated in regulation of membrane protease activity
MPLATVEDKDDVFVENLNSAFLLLLGALAVFGSVVLFVYSGFVAFSGQPLAMGLLATPAFAAFLLILGWVSLHLFRRRRRQRKEKLGSIFYHSR